VEIQENDSGGQSVVLAAGDDLRTVPKSHRRLITATIRDAFRDPTAYFRNVADRCPFKQMARWLKALLAENQWELELHRGFGKHASAGFAWDSEMVRGAMIGLPVDQDLSGFPATLQEYYALIDQVAWNGFGCAGGLAGVGEHPPLCVLRCDFHGAKVNLEETFIWGSSPCGDMLIYTADDRGGWLNHGSHQIHLLGTIAGTINWVYSELLARRCPEWDHHNWDGS
jgi:hypothetical protein